MAGVRIVLPHLSLRAWPGGSWEWACCPALRVSQGQFNARKKADREHCCFSANHRTYSGVLGDRIGSACLVGMSALAELLHEGREPRPNDRLRRRGVGARIVTAATQPEL
jgi:hypothetical protein